MIVVSSFLSGFSSLPFYLCVWMCAFIRDSFSDRLNFATLNFVSQMQCYRTRLLLIFSRGEQKFHFNLH